MRLGENFLGIAVILLFFLIMYSALKKQSITDTFKEVGAMLGSAFKEDE